MTKNERSHLLESTSIRARCVWPDLQRGQLVAGSREEAMSYGIGITVAFITGIIRLILVAAAAMLGAQRRATEKNFRRSIGGCGPQQIASYIRPRAAH